MSVGLDLERQDKQESFKQGVQDKQRPWEKHCSGVRKWPESPAPESLGFNPAHDVQALGHWSGDCRVQGSSA